MKFDRESNGNCGFSPEASLYLTPLSLLGLQERKYVCDTTAGRQACIGSIGLREQKGRGVIPVDETGDFECHKT